MGVNKWWNVTLLQIKNLFKLILGDLSTQTLLKINVETGTTHWPAAIFRQRELALAMKLRCSDVCQKDHKTKAARERHVKLHIDKLNLGKSRSPFTGKLLNDNRPRTKPMTNQLIDAAPKLLVSLPLTYVTFIYTKNQQRDRTRNTNQDQK